MCETGHIVNQNMILTMFNSYDGGPYHTETSPLTCRANRFLYDRDLRHERVKTTFQNKEPKCLIYRDYKNFLFAK